MVLPETKDMLLYIGERIFYYFFIFLCGVGLGYVWAMKAYQVGLFN